MFPCACSLRSTHCAALIALAAAAGIVRVTPAVTAQALAPAPVAAVASKPLRYPVGLQAVALKFTFTLFSVAPAAEFQRTAPLDPQRMAWDGVWGGWFLAADSAPKPVEAAISTAAKSTAAGAGSRGTPGARDHVIPFAVGPPAARAASTRHAVPGKISTRDSAASGDIVQESSSRWRCGAQPRASVRPSCPPLPRPTRPTEFTLRGDTGLSERGVCGEREAHLLSACVAAGPAVRPYLGSRGWLALATRVPAIDRPDPAQLRARALT